MKVLWIIHGDEPYGVKQAITSLMEGVRATGWQAEAVSLGGGECFETLVSRGFDVSCLGMAESPGLQKAKGKIGWIWHALKLAKYQRGACRRIFEEIQQRQPDAVHTLAKNVLPAVAAAAKRSGTVCFWEIATILGSGYPFDLNRRLHHALIHRKRIFTLANSHYTAKTLGPTDPKTEVMYLGVDSLRFNPKLPGTVARSEIGIPHDAIVFAIVARIDRSKGQELFLKGLIHINDPRVHLLLVGGDSGNGDLQRIGSLAKQHGFGDRVHFVGYRAEPRSYLQIADVVVNAYLGAEAFGLSAVEAMMMGKPVLAHALGGPAETVLDGETGWHVKTPTVEGFSDGIERCLRDRSRWKELGLSARRRALELFSLESQTTRYRAIVQNAIAQAKS